MEFEDHELPSSWRPNMLVGKKHGSPRSFTLYKDELRLEFGIDYPSSRLIKDELRFENGESGYLSCPLIKFLENFRLPDVKKITLLFRRNFMIDKNELMSFVTNNFPKRVEVMQIRFLFLRNSFYQRIWLENNFNILSLSSKAVTDTFEVSSCRINRSFLKKICDDYSYVK